MSIDLDYWPESTPSCGIKFRIGSQKCRSWEPEQVYPRPQNRRKLGRRASSVVACFWGGQKSRRCAKRSESFSERQTYRPVYWKSLDISVTVPDGSLKRVIGDDRMQVWDLVAPLAAELRLREPRLFMAEGGAPVDSTAPAALLQGEALILQEGEVPWDARSANDVRLRLVEELLSSEKEYCHTLKTVADLYEKPLRKLLSMEKEDYKSFFDWVEPICSLSKMVIIKLNVAVEEWETYETKVGSIFSKLLWTKYEEYLNLYLDITLPLLKDKQESDEDFVALCQLRRGAAKYSLDDLLQLPVKKCLTHGKSIAEACQIKASTQKIRN